MAYSQADIDALDNAIKTGAVRVRFQDREVTYRDMKSLLEARNLAVAEVNAANATMPLRQLRVYTTKGF